MILKVIYLEYNSIKGKTLLDYTNLFSPKDFKKNDQLIKIIFKNE